MSENKMKVTVNLIPLSEKDFVAKGKSMVKAQIDNPTYVPGLSPTALVVQGKFDTQDSLIATRASLKLLLKENTLNLRAIRSEITDNITDDWAPQTQKACAGSPEKVVALGFGIKGEEDGESEPVANVKNSYPELDPLVKGIHLQHTLKMVNSLTKKIAMPPDAKDIDIYIYFGDPAPADYTDMKYLGSAVKGQFTATFTEDQVGKIVWYCAVYVPRRKGANLLVSKVKALVS